MIIGQRAVIDDILIALFCDSHILLVGVPGPAHRHWIIHHALERASESRVFDPEGV